MADGNPAAGLVVVGEAPSAADLETGRPFSGPAGQLLDRMLAAIGRDRGSAYLTLLCPRLPHPGPPPDDAIAADLALTLEHLRLVAPRAVLVLGAIPARSLLGRSEPIAALRGTWCELDLGDVRVPALPTFNPAYLLRRPDAKRAAWADLLALKARLGG